MKIGIGILGFGTVGSGVCKAIERNKDHIRDRFGAEFLIRKVLVRDLTKARNAELPGELFTNDFQAVMGNDDIQVIIEVMGGIEPANTYIRAALAGGKHVITANKALLAAKGPELKKLADENRVTLRYEASVAGAIPILTTLDNALAGEMITELSGIVNGTTNYILSRMSEEGLDFGDVLADAQRLGYAEADPTADVEAFDATYKLCILAKRAFGYDAAEPDVLREGITKVSRQDIALAKELGCAIKLLAIGRKADDRLELRVHPTLVPMDHPIARISGPFNGVFLKGNCFGEMMLYGRGAGDLPTASAIMGDLITTLRQSFLSDVLIPLDFSAKAVLLEREKISTGRFLRLELRPESKAFEAIAALLAKRSVSIKAMRSLPEENGVCPAGILTGAVREADVELLLQELSALEDVLSVKGCLRAELEL